MRIIWIIDNQSTTKPITVLSPEVTVVPERPLKGIEVSFSTSYKYGQGKHRLAWDREVVQKAFVWYDGALCDRIDTIGPVGVQLEDAMPMLRRGNIKVPNPSLKQRDLTTEVTLSKKMFSSPSRTSI